MTRLEAVNAVLNAIGDTPINTLEGVLTVIMGCILFVVILYVASIGLYNIVEKLLEK